MIYFTGRILGDLTQIIQGGGGFKKYMKDGRVTYRVSPPGSYTWTVVFLPDAAYVHVTNATHRRHGNDIDHRDITASDIGFGGCF